MRTLTLTEARRLAVMSQRLAAARPGPSARAILETVHALGHLQLDPTNAVARSHLLVLWSRLGPYDEAHLDTLLWKQRRLIEYRAFIYPMEDYSLHAWRMRRFEQGDGTWPRRIRAFMEKNRALRQYVLTRLRREGPLPSRAFEDRSVMPWSLHGWVEHRPQREPDAGVPLRAGPDHGRRPGWRAASVGSERASPSGVDSP